MPSRPIIETFAVQDRFSSLAPRLRAEFCKRFERPMDAAGGRHARRFVWDYWHVPKKFRLLRTRPNEVFEKDTFERMVREIADWGREHLGCHGLSPIWLSCYVDGCEQRWHRDEPHGPWAFVYSLSPPVRGGDTILRVGERIGKKIRIAPKFNRLVVFDPSLSHSVSKVRKALDVLEGRLVLHGWFVPARPFVEGPLGAKALAEHLDQWSPSIPHEGTVIARFDVSPEGKVRAFRWLSSSVKGWPSREKTKVLNQWKTYWMRTQWPKCRTKSRVTLPILFSAKESS